ncbi:MAG: ATP-dependent Clp protease adaptor ClpS [Ktedonobacteraceae bacterium]
MPIFMFERETLNPLFFQLAPQCQHRPNVILHRDDDHQIEYVVIILCQVVGALQEAEAQKIATTTCTKVKDVVVTSPLEMAEHYQAQLQRYGLTVTLDMSCWVFAPKMYRSQSKRKTPFSSKEAQNGAFYERYL